MIGRSIAHYRIEAQLGAGGMGVVYRARDTRLERDVALKLLSEEMAARGKADLLLREARAASALNHPHVATVYEAGEQDGHAFIVMEYVAGRPLSQMIPAGGLPVESVLRYGQQVASALAHAHERGIVHRDLKSANVVITAEGQAKVLDFGLAQRVTHKEVDEATRSRVAVEGGIAGTLAYLAPEVLRGDAADARSDIWALGVVLYEMAAGRLPFEGRSGFDLTSAIIRERPATLGAQTPPGLRGVIERCLAKEPGQRYRSAGEVQAALEAISSSHEQAPPTAAAAPGPAVAQAPWWQGKAVWGIAVLAVILAAAIWKGPALFAPAGRETTPTGPRTSTGAPASANKEASEYFERGMLLHRSGLQLPRAREMFERALELDPKFAEARAWYGTYNLLMVGGGFSNDSAWFYKGEEELHRALADDPNLSSAHSSLARLYMYQGRKELMPATLDRAEALNPHNLDAAVWRFFYQFHNGNFPQARAIAEEIVERDPLYRASHLVLGEVDLAEGKFADAVRNFQRPLIQDPQNVLVARRLARAHVLAGDTSAARRVLEALPAEHRHNFLVRLVWAPVYAREGRPQEARREMDAEVLKFAGLHAMYILEAAEFHALLGDKPSALEWLERAVGKGDERADWFRRNPLLESIRDEPRLRQILDSIAFRRQQRKTGS